MNKFGVVLGIAAVATLAGCKDPDYKHANSATTVVGITRTSSGLSVAKLALGFLQPARVATAAMPSTTPNLFI